MLKCSFGRLVVPVLLVAASMLSGCASHYLDKSTQEVPVAQFRKPAAPQAVQLVFEFQTKGAPNATATKFLKDGVLKQVQESGLFSSVQEEPSTGAALLNITLNNVPLTDDAFSKGFAAGLTFGLAGASVSDGYICTAKYLAPASNQALEKSARHAIHTTIGNAATPGNAEKIENIQDGVRKMARQIVSQVLNDLSADARFK